MQLASEVMADIQQLGEARLTLDNNGKRQVINIKQTPQGYVVGDGTAHLQRLDVYSLHDYIARISDNIVSYG